MRLDTWITSAAERLAESGVESPRLEAQILAAHGVGKERAWLLAHGDEAAPLDRLETMLLRRGKREPLAYILGYREFFGRRFAVDSRVLIPRPETESLVEFALSLYAAEEPIRVLDLATGSGCIGITLALERPHWEVWASDVSPDALDVAKANAANLGADVRFELSDLFQSLPNETFDLVVTNPPYIAGDAQLMPEVRKWEPPGALYSGVDGFEIYRRLAEEGMSRLTKLITEVGDGQAEVVATLFLERGWRVEGTAKDLIGHERALLLTPSW